jgi:type IV pilus assembly protein PilA
VPNRPHHQAGFTVVELIITTCIVAVLASIALTQMRDYTRRARVSEVVTATGQCKNTVAENYLIRDSTPDAGTWGCEGPGRNTKYAGRVQTSSNGVIRVTVENVDPLMNGRHVHLVPARSGGSTPMYTPADLGKGVQGWICGSDWLPVRNALPANCRSDTTTFSSDDFN